MNIVYRKIGFKRDFLRFLMYKLQIYFYLEFSPVMSDDNIKIFDHSDGDQNHPKDQQTNILSQS